MPTNTRSNDGSDDAENGIIDCLAKTLFAHPSSPLTAFANRQRMDRIEQCKELKQSCRLAGRRSTSGMRHAGPTKKLKKHPKIWQGISQPRGALLKLPVSSSGMIHQVPTMNGTMTKPQNGVCSIRRSPLYMTMGAVTMRGREANNIRCPDRISARTAPSKYTSCGLVGPSPSDVATIHGSQEMLFRSTFGINGEYEG